MSRTDGSSYYGTPEYTGRPAMPLWWCVVSNPLLLSITYFAAMIGFGVWFLGG